MVWYMVWYYEVPLPGQHGLQRHKPLQERHNKTGNEELKGLIGSHVYQFGRACHPAGATDVTRMPKCCQESAWPARVFEANGSSGIFMNARING